MGDRGWVPIKLGGGVDGAKEGHNPLGEWATLDRNEGHKNTDSGRDDHKRPLYKYRKGEAVKDKSNQ